MPVWADQLCPLGIIPDYRKVNVINIASTNQQGSRRGATDQRMLPPARSHPLGHQAGDLRSSSAEDHIPAWRLNRPEQKASYPQGVPKEHLAMVVPARDA